MCRLRQCPISPPIPYGEADFWRPAWVWSTRSRRPTRRFNEAAGIHRRKRCIPTRAVAAPITRFNEAAGIHRRKRARALAHLAQSYITASMRPPEFTGGNLERLEAKRQQLFHGFNEAAGIHRAETAKRRLPSSAGF